MGAISRDLRLPRDFEEVARLVSPDDVARTVVCGPDPERYMAAIQQYTQAGFDHVYLHQIGADQEGFFGFFERELVPRLSEPATAAAR
jgi:hypothetical protein